MLYTMSMNIKLNIQIVILSLFGITACLAPTFAAENREVAYIEEVIFSPDGSQETYRYKPGERPSSIMAEKSQRIAGPLPDKPRQRKLNSVESQELAQLEIDFAHGKIAETEYYLKKRELYAATFVDGQPDRNEWVF
ncbi:MAG: hypothetical protein ACI9CF_001989 [Candidatus Omnitrophota bacterium]|jgi:hypothetical protein